MGIQILEKQVAELIAAGEVIERPASVVKEILENAIDAGASTISLEIKNGGKTYIRITDNGCGIPFKEVPYAFYRHATSKVKEKEDLDHITTLGFRGEALASICAVSKVEVRTKCIKDTFGTQYRIEGGEEKNHEEFGCPNGTTVVIRDLFYNVPARRKFLKKDITEAAAIHGIIQKIAISHPEVSFSFVKDGKSVLRTPGTNDLHAAIYAIYGSAFVQNLILVENSQDGVTINGYITAPTESRANRSMQHFFINGRYIKSNTCKTALEEAYKGSMMTGRFPGCVLLLHLPEEQVDVNVHPAKIEIRFADENMVLRSVYTAVKTALQKYTRSIVNNKVNLFQQKKQVTRLPDASYLGDKNAPLTLHDDIVPLESLNTQPRAPRDVSGFKHISADSFTAKEEKLWKDRIFSEDVDSSQSVCSADLCTKKDPTQLYDAENDLKIAKPSLEELSLTKTTSNIHIIGEAFQTYILAEIGEELVFMDKHAAHERLIYNEIKKNIKTWDRQVLLSPITVSLSANEFAVIKTYLNKFLEFGFLVEAFGDHEVIIRESPPILQQENIAAVFQEIVHNLYVGKQDLTPEAFESIYHMMACKAAIKGNEYTSEEELVHLFEEVFYDEKVRFCPHGRPVTYVISKSKLERQFRR